ncbi:bifunctional GNAT family N-acetyltransferase/hotdog fold thioesterase [Celerinatantimonas yamalensis]|uniref:Bifunctional GNAT family N-acetyltransferase/hotdog fold thioesterase n=1 Tax=Celerinatantimonas yamalensis TaxID=559956 RepID=A0ABW9GAN0_9GAMM
MPYQIVTPETDEQLARYYQFRWEVLNKPLQLPLGSERDAYDTHSQHRMVVDDRDTILAIGRLFITDSEEALIRHIAVNPDYRKQGLGLIVMRSLEQAALDEGVQRIVLTARDQDSQEFFTQAGYLPDGEPYFYKRNLFQQQMVKRLDERCQFIRHPELCHKLYQEIYKRIPLSEKIGIKLTRYDDQLLETRLSLGGNANVYESMFAGSSYCQALLTAWSLLWLALQELNMDAEIVLIDAQIQHRRPIQGECSAQALLGQIKNMHRSFSSGHSRTRFKIAVALYSGDRLVAEFEGFFLLRRLQCRRPKEVDQGR